MEVWQRTQKTFPLYDKFVLEDIDERPVILREQAAQGFPMQAVVFVINLEEPSPPSFIVSWFLVVYLDDRTSFHHNWDETKTRLADWLTDWLIGGWIDC